MNLIVPRNRNDWEGSVSGFDPALFEVNATDSWCYADAEGRLVSIRKRTWKNADGAESTAWIVDLVDANGQRERRQFESRNRGRT